MQLEQLEYVLEVARCGSINAAAKSLYLSQPSLSLSIRNLEQELGIEIFSRTTHGVSLTADGTEFIEYARRVLEQKDLLEEHFHQGGRDLQRFSVSAQFSPLCVCAFSALLKEEDAEKYRFSIFTRPPSRIIDDVQARRSDLGIFRIRSNDCQRTETALRTAGLDFDEVCTGTAHVLFASTHALAGRDAVAVSDLEPFPRLIFEEGTGSDVASAGKGGASAGGTADLSSATVASDKEIAITDWAFVPPVLKTLDAYLPATDFEIRAADIEDCTSVPFVPEQKVALVCAYPQDRPLDPLQLRFLELLKGCAAA
ncbi:MAG: LysR family transcriptional regulator [Coriobacteriaceae bacterium]|nr:LysR family transcriptional regulator [Coriobacteriaceae bacterium]